MRIPGKTICETQRQCIKLQYSKDKNQDAEFWRRMALVRTLQSTFYSSPDNMINSTSTAKCKIDLLNGTIQNLPMWRVGWTELPGRSNVLFINEPTYTHMFEQIMRTTEKPWYFGHLFLEGGSTSLKKARSASKSNSKTNTTTSMKEDELYSLKSWKDEITPSIIHTSDESSLSNNINGSISDEIKDSSNDEDYVSATISGQKSSAVGVLMRVVDLRRMNDGRILLLVQALERFVVSHVYQEFPYAIADAQLLPDLEETTFSMHTSSKSQNTLSESTEAQTFPYRVQTISEAFESYHDYEYDYNVELPVKNGADVTVSDVFGPDLKRIMPFIPFSSKSFTPLISNEQNSKENALNNDIGIHDSSEPSLESQLIGGGILRNPPTHPEMCRNDKLPPGILEEQLWIQIDQFIRIRYGQSSLFHRTRETATTKLNRVNTKRATFNLPISPNLLALLPRNKKWPNHFILEDIANNLTNDPSQFTDEPTFIRVSESYPAYKRQKRLSFTSSALLEKMPMGGGSILRQILLEIPSTQARLCFVVERFEMMNDQLIGNVGEFM